ncbi:pectin lyase-like protein [Mycena rosella]|uniref:Pectin lyase-like protein n=1 Tax=Mycena rosella TaxID=1033263 RepID=A0AAD7D1E7_MYCRO|nr:pectin lyase-like protein [Mycena rosella]
MLSRALALAALALPAAAFIECNVLSYGAVSDNATDLGPALTAAWNNCVIPQATTVATDVLLFTNVVFNGAKKWNLHITGNIYLPYIPTLTGTMLTFQNCQNIILNGPGAIFGNGLRYRPGGDLGLHPSRPRLIRFQDCNNCEISSVTLYDAPQFHVTMIGNNNVAHNMAIIATNIGDECVTVKTPTNGFVGENIRCKFTAGCNIGSFGSANTAVDVRNVRYNNVTISNSDAGVEFKAYPNNIGTVTNITYTGFTLRPHTQSAGINSFWAGDGVDTGKLSITDVTFSNFVGTGTPTRPAVTLNCNKATPCKNIKFSDISITNAKANSFTNACGSGVTGIPAC